MRRRRPVARKKIEIPDEISASLRDTYNSLCLKVGNTSRSLKRLDAKRQRVRRPFTPSQSERYERDLRALETSLQAMETIMKRINAAWRDLGEKRVIFESAHFRNLRNKHDPCPPEVDSDRVFPGFSWFFRDIAWHSMIRNSLDSLQTCPLRSLGLCSPLENHVFLFLS